MDIHDYWSGDRPGCVLTQIHEPDYRQLPAEEMEDRAVRNLSAWATSSANLPPALFPDFGTVSTATSWGGTPRRTDEGEWFIPPVAGDLDEALAIDPAPNPHATRAADLYRAVQGRTGIRDLGFKSIDFQGPLNTAALVVNQDELMVGMYAEPDKVHALLDRVTDHLIATVRGLKKAVGRLDGNIWPYLWVPDSVGVMLTEDIMPLISTDLYREFGIPYLRRIADALGGVFIHCCGEWGRHARTLAESGVNILGAEFHYPFTRIEELAEPFAGKVLAPFYAGFKTTDFGGLPGYLDHLLRNRPSDISLWLPYTDAEFWPVADLREVMARHGFGPEGFWSPARP